MLECWNREGGRIDRRTAIRRPSGDYGGPRSVVAVSSRTRQSASLQRHYSTIPVFRHSK
jgi:hypothetical protein